MASGIIYREVVKCSFRFMIKQFLIANLIITLLIPVAVRSLMAGVENMQLATWGIMFRNYILHPPLAMLVPTWLLIGILVFFTNRIEISIRDNILYLPAESRYEPRQIPLSDLLFFRERSYGPRSFFQFINSRKDSEGVIHQVVPLSGYTGPGFEIGFLRVRRNVSNLKNIIFSPHPELEKKEIRVHFPCRRPGQLSEFIKQCQDKNCHKGRQ